MTASMSNVPDAKNVRHKTRDEALVHFLSKVAAGKVLKQVGSTTRTFLTANDFPDL